MKLMRLSLILCIMPSLAQASSFAKASEDRSSDQAASASSSASSATAQPATQTFARIIKLASLSPEERSKREKNDIDRRGNLFLIHDGLMYAGKPKNYWKSLGQFVDQQGNPPDIKPADVLVRTQMCNKDDRTLSWHAMHPQSFPEYVPLEWIDNAQAGDLIEFRIKRPGTAIGTAELECKDGTNGSFGEILKQKKKTSPTYHMDEIPLLVAAGALKKNPLYEEYETYQEAVKRFESKDIAEKPKPSPALSLYLNNYSDGSFLPSGNTMRIRFTSLGLPPEYVPGPNGFKPTTQSSYE